MIYGRTARLEYNGFFLVHLCCCFDLFLVIVVTQFRLPITAWVLMSYVAVSMLPSITMKIRRLHDVGKSGNWLWLLFLPPVSFVLELILAFKTGDIGRNVYGPDPYDNYDVSDLAASVVLQDYSPAPRRIAESLLTSAVVPDVETGAPKQTTLSESKAAFLEKLNASSKVEPITTTVLDNELTSEQPLLTGNEESAEFEEDSNNVEKQ